ncbi:MAG: hypothetical protein IIC90_04605 [Chloroflexi bacterium]|nr:hypothetical protein [Chloroflexota bacterium]
MHPLDGPFLKLRCAKREIQALRTVQDSFQSQSHYEIVRAEFNPRTGKYVYRILMDVLPPVDIGVTIGEIAHNLRSALDNLTWQLARLETRTPYDRTQFPIFSRRFTARRDRHGNRLPQFERDGRRYLQSLRPEHQAAIERYIGGRGFRRHPLFRLHEINNTDKHRLFQVVATKPSAIIWGEWPGVRSGKSRLDDVDAVWFGGFKDGAKVLEAPSDVNVYPKIRPLIAFGVGGPGIRHQGVCGVFSLIAEQVSEIIESFRPEFG